MTKQRSQFGCGHRQTAQETTESYDTPGWQALY